MQGKARLVAVPKYILRAEAIIKDQSQLFYVTIEMCLYFCLKTFYVCKAGNLFQKIYKFGSNLFYSW